MCKVILHFKNGAQVDFNAEIDSDDFLEFLRDNFGKMKNIFFETKDGKVLADPKEIQCYEILEEYDE